MRKKAFLASLVVVNLALLPLMGEIVKAQGEPVDQDTGCVWTRTSDGMTGCIRDSCPTPDC